METTKDLRRFHLLLTGFVIFVVLLIVSLICLVVFLFQGETFWPFILTATLFGTLARRFFLLTAEAACEGKP